MFKMRQEIKDSCFDRQDLTDPKFWDNHHRFKNCTFIGSYLGSSQRGGSAPTIDISHVKFIGCDFQGCNFLGVRGLEPKNFDYPFNLATTYNLPSSVVDSFPFKPNSYSDSYVKMINRPGVLNIKLQQAEPQSKITNFFSIKKPLGNRVAEDSHQEALPTLRK